MPSRDGWSYFFTKSTTALETASVILNQISRFATPEVIHADQGPAFHNAPITEITRLCGMEHSSATSYSREEKWTFEQLPLVQRIMNTAEKTSTGVTPAELFYSPVIPYNEEPITCKELLERPPAQHLAVVMTQVIHPYPTGSLGKRASENYRNLSEF